MATLKVKTISTLKEYSDFIHESLDAKENYWFRGLGKAPYELKPSLYRHPAKTDAQELLELEKELMIRFKQRSLPFLNRKIENEWDQIFLMQHYGAPTRLLDWTENPFIGLFFALVDAKKDTSTKHYTEDAAVWCVNPAKWNYLSLQHLSYGGGVLTIADKRVNTYSPETDFKFMPSDPVAIHGTYNSPRIVAQRGAFTIFGKNTQSMEEIYKKYSTHEEILVKLVLPRDKIGLLLEATVNMGYSDSVIYPDLDGLAKEIKRYFKYEV